jgi:predicted MFS family arabinose efflux permease
VVAAPAGSFFGAVIGWRYAFFCLVPISAIALLWKLISLPRMEAEGGSGPGNLLKILGRRRIAVGMAAVSLFFMGQFTLFTYLRPFLEAVTGVGASTLSFLLLGMGVAGFVGTTLIGRFLKENLYRTLTVIPVLMAVIAVALIHLGSSMVMAAVLLSVWGLIATAAPVAWWTWLARSLPEDAEAGGGLMVAIIQLAITFGATIGGVLFDMSGYQATFGASSVLLLLGAALAAVAARLGLQRTMPERHAENAVNTGEEANYACS